MQVKMSKIDQVNLSDKIEEWKKKTPDASFFLRPFKPDAAPPNTLMYVHQEKWQRELLKKYGNEICLIDATYKTTKYALPLFFVCVKTNCGYAVVGK